MTVKPFFIGRHRDLKVVSVLETCPLHRRSFKLDYFVSKTYSRVLEYNAIDPKMCQEAGFGRRRSLETEY